MCLTETFFNKRMEISLEYERKNRLILEEFLDNYSLSKKDLISSGLFRSRKIITTADLYDIELTQEGKQYFLYNPHELFFIKAKINPEQLFDYIVKAKMAHI